MQLIFGGVIIVLTFAVILQIAQECSIKMIDFYLKKLTIKTFDYIWIIIVYFIIQILNIDINYVSRIDQYKNSILFLLCSYIILEILLKYKESWQKYLYNNIKYINIFISVGIVIEWKLSNVFVNNWMLLLLFMIDLTCIFEIYDECCNKNKIKKSYMDERECESYDELFPTRRKQADSIIEFINSFQKYDRFTLLLNGDWGTGKTSLIKGVEEKYKAEFKENNKDDCSMIFIQPMLFDKKELLIEYFFEQLKIILSSGGIYTGKDSNVEKYISLLSNWIVEKNNIGLIKNLSNKDKSFREVKNQLQQDIYKYRDKGKIIVIIDDFDRVEKDTVKEILMFIREVIDFDGIGRVILMEYSKLVKLGLSENYLDKYIDKRIDLNKVELKEVVERFIKWCIEDEFEQSEDNEDILRTRLNNFATNFEKIMDEILNNIRRPLETNDNTRGILVRNWDEVDVKGEQEFKEKYNSLLERIQKETNNIRLMKKIIRELISSYIKLQKGYESKIELTDDDIIYIFKFILIKNLFIDEYNNMQKCVNFAEYFNDIYFASNVEKKCISILLSEIKQGIFKLKTINRYLIIDAILTSNFNGIDYQTKTEGDKILEKIDSVKELKEEGIFLLNSFQNYQEYIEFFEKIYNYIYNDFYEKGNYKETKKRLKKVNLYILKITKNIDENQLDIIFEVRYKCIRFYERFQLNYILIKDIYTNVNIFKVNKPNDIQIVNKYIESIREANLNHLAQIVKIYLRATGSKDKKLKEIYLNLKEFNEDFSETLDLKVEKTLTEIDKFNCLLNQLKSKLRTSGDFKYLNVNYLYTNITKHQIFEAIIFRIEKYITNNKEAKKMDVYCTRSYIESIGTYNEYEEISISLLNKIIQKNNRFTYDDLNNCYGIIKSAQRFKNDNDITVIIKLMDRVCKLINKNIFTNEYNYIEVQNLILNFKELKGD